MRYGQGQPMLACTGDVLHQRSGEDAGLAMRPQLNPSVLTEFPKLARHSRGLVGLGGNPRSRAGDVGGQSNAPARDEPS